MADKIIIAIPTILLAAIILSLVAKLFLFMQYKTRKDKWLYLLYYPQTNIAVSSCRKRKQLKLLQNRLTRFMLLVVPSYLLVLLML